MERLSSLTRLVASIKVANVISNEILSNVKNEFKFINTKEIL